jgi:hypothetical protein
MIFWIFEEATHEIGHTMFIAIYRIPLKDIYNAKRKFELLK